MSQNPPQKPRVVDRSTLASRGPLQHHQHHQHGQQQQGQQQRPIDIRQTKQYKIALRRWTSVMVALPILFYTSYVLWDRTYGSQRTVKKLRRPGDDGAEN